MTQLVEPAPIEEQPAATRPVLAIRDLSVSFDGSRGDRVRAVKHLDLTIHPRQTVALVGESGCGKSVTALSVLRLLPPQARIDGGTVVLDDRDLLALPDAEMRRVRGGRIAMIFQEPIAALNPVFTIGEQIIEAIRLHQHVGRRAARRVAVEALRDVGIASPERGLRSYPHEFSGGMCQRAMLAMALVCRPDLLIADEPTTALDVTTQARLLDLLDALKRRTGMSMLLITHDLGVVARAADVVCVMYDGSVVEYADVFELFERPMHAYTRALLAAVPRVEGDRAARRGIGEASMDERAAAEVAAQRLVEVRPGHWVAGGIESAPDEPAKRPPDSPFRRADDG